MSSQPEGREIEEHFVLRVKDTELAKQIRDVLQGHSILDENESMKFHFEEDEKYGKLLFKGKEYPLSVLNLPCVTETYKTFDDINYVKVTDVGQVLVVGEPEPARVQGEALDGITPPMRNARNRIFKPQQEVDPQLVNDVEYSLLTILAGGAPKGVKFVDYEEEYKINESTGQGEWVSVTR